MIIEVIAVLFLNAPAPILFNKESAPNVTEIKQPANTTFPILVTLAGMVIEFKLVQFQNAALPILSNVEFA